ncbi:hypothetical protein, partial [Methylobacterium nigriterrae]|uniref:hypothetical protein n=1 Tax=Methylobacterium nigriterrae TaxID=3127512 RepID=UPI0030138AA0
DAKATIKAPLEPPAECSVIAGSAASTGKRQARKPFPCSRLIQDGRGWLGRSSYSFRLSAALGAYPEWHLGELKTQLSILGCEFEQELSGVGSHSPHLSAGALIAPAAAAPRAVASMPRKAAVIMPWPLVFNASNW